jgi:hypothetical protein
MLTFDIQGTGQLFLTARQNQSINIVMAFETDGEPYILTDATAIEFVVRQTNAAGKVILSLDLDSGITVDSNQVTISDIAPTYNGFEGAAVFSLVVTIDGLTRSFVEGPLTIKAYNAI